MLQRPNKEDVCGFCNHQFGIHYQTYSGNKMGCTFTYSDQRDGEYDCACKGYAVVYKYQEDYPGPG